MLQKLRIGLAGLIWGSLTVFFLVGVPSPGAKLQLIPALLAANVVSLLIIAAITILFGRVYCSCICPLGILQDGIIWLKSKRCSVPAQFHNGSDWLILRYSILVVLALAFAGGFSILPSLLDPYSIYGRMVMHLAAPIWQAGVNLLAAGLDKFDFYWIEKYEGYSQGYRALAVAAASFLGISAMAWTRGRLYCNALCPVGTILGTISRFALFRVAVDPERCGKCGVCARKCKAACINVEAGKIDHSRCVNCFDCINSCPQQAIHFQWAGKKASVSAETGISRRKLLATTAITAAAVGAAAMEKAGASVAKIARQDKAPVSPPGSKSHEHFNESCTACHLCISQCPQQVLTPATLAYGIVGILQPVLDFSRGYCEYDCERCGEVCPTQAIGPLTLQEKRRVKIGYAVYNAKQCLVTTDDLRCGSCAIHCPTQAIKLVKSNGREVPSIERSLCIGCGSCEYHCPTNPPAINVIGLRQHEYIRK